MRLVPIQRSKFLCIVFSSLVLVSCGGASTSTGALLPVNEPERGNNSGGNSNSEPTPVPATPTPTPAPPEIENPESNNPPVATADNFQVLEDGRLTSLDVLQNDFDEDGDSISVVAVSVDIGEITRNGNLIDYAPPENFFGPVVASYSISDGFVTRRAEINIHVLAVDDLPVVAGEETTINEDESLIRFAVLDNDVDLDSDNLFISNATATTGVVAINARETLSYTPPINFNGDVTIQYSVSDGVSHIPAELSITVTPVNDAPVAIADDVITLEEDAFIENLAILDNDSDVDNALNTLAIIIVSVENGNVIVNDDNTITYTPNENYFGEDLITYQLNDGELFSEVVEIPVLVTAVNDVPVATHDSVTIFENTAVNAMEVISNDVDVDNELSELSLSSVALTQGVGTLDNNDNSITFTPPHQYFGDVIIEYTVTDGDLVSEPTTFTITITEVRDPPVAVNDINLNVDEDNTLENIDVLANDTDVDTDTEDLSIASASATVGDISINPDNTLDYTPPENFNGNVNVSYQLFDGDNTSNTATFNVLVSAVNDAPVANADTANTIETTPVLIDVLANDTDVDNEWLSISTDELPTADNGMVTIENNQLRYTANSNFIGNDTLTYTVTDGDLSHTATVSITVDDMTYTQRLSWRDPLFRENGLPLVNTEISQYIVEYKLESDSDFTQQLNISKSEYDTNAAADVEVTESGHYDIRIRIETTDGAVGLPSESFRVLFE